LIEHKTAGSKNFQLSINQSQISHCKSAISV
jgi:hypothetical protein